MIGIHPSLCPGVAMLLEQEAERLFPYNDKTGQRFKLTDGNLTISVGINLDSGGLLAEESRFILFNRIEETRKYLDSRYAWFNELNDVRRWVIISMTHHMGREGFHKFQNTRTAIEYAIEITKTTTTLTFGYLRAWENVGHHMMDSQWAKNFINRAAQLQRLMINGFWS